MNISLSAVLVPPLYPVAKLEATENLRPQPSTGTQTGGRGHQRMDWTNHHFKVCVDILYENIYLQSGLGDRNSLISLSWA